MNHPDQYLMRIEPFIGILLATGALLIWKLPENPFIGVVILVAFSCLVIDFLMSLAKFLIKHRREQKAEKKRLDDLEDIRLMGRKLWGMD